MLTTCRECRAECSTEATNCPKCGCPSPDFAAHHFRQFRAAEAAHDVKRTQGELRLKSYALCGLAVFGLVLAAIGFDGTNEYAAAGPLGLIILVGSVATLLGGLPGAIARGRQHPQATAITICGWIGLLTFGVVWLVALIWAHTGKEPETTATK